MKKKMSPRLARLLANYPVDMPDDPEINQRLVTLANNARQKSMYRAVLPALVELSDAGMSDEEMFRLYSADIEQWLGYASSYTRNFWKTIKREQPELIEDIRKQLKE
jgi:hypothetical protein